MDFSGKTLVVCGGISGIGLETAKIMLGKGLTNLAILDIQDIPETIKSLVTQFPKATVVYFKMDICKKEQIDETFKKIFAKFKTVDILLNACGIIAERDINRTMEVNLIGTIHTTYAVYEHMNKMNGGIGGMIVNVASVLGLEPCPPIMVYSASKFGVMGFTRSLSYDYYYTKTGVAMVTICPGITDTPLLNQVASKPWFDFSQELLDKEFLMWKRQTPEACAANVVGAIEQNINGSIWICDLGKLIRVNPTKYWEGVL